VAYDGDDTTDIRQTNRESSRLSGRIYQRDGQR